TSLCHALELSILGKFPAALAHGDAALPECVRSAAVDLEGALLRQLRARGGGTAALARGTVVTAQLLLETYVFRVESVAVEAPSPSDGAALTRVRVHGWKRGDHERNAARKEATEARTEDPMRAPSHADLFERRLRETGLAGYDALVRDVLLSVALVTKPDSRAGGCDHLLIGSHGLLLTGVPGVGKSLVLRALQREVARAGIPATRVDGMSLLMEAENSRLSSAYEFLAHQVQEAFPAFDPEAAVQRSPVDRPSLCQGVLLIDDVDVLFQTPSGEPAGESEAAEALSPLGSALLRLLDTVSASSRICVVGTATGAATTIPSAAKRAGRFGKTIEVMVPTESMRASILAHHLTLLPLSSGLEDPLAVNVEACDTTDPEARAPQARAMASRLAALTGGYVAKDLDLVAAQQLVKPSQLRELNVASPGAATQSDGALAFAGYAALQRQLVDLITWKFRPTAAMHRLGVADASGILVHGPSGCGKSLLVRTLAAQAGVNFVSVKSSELMSKYFGDSEKAVRQLFARARAASPCILFFDEFDAIAHKRSFGGDGGGSGGESVYARILSTFLNEMDGVGASSTSSAETKGEILVIAATNRVDALDAALVRPGRIDKAVELGLPDAADKEAILAHYTRKMPLAADVSISALANRSTGGRSFTGADLSAVCKDAALRALREDIDAACVSMRHFDAAWRRRAASPVGASTA
ncbi:hypothetical protein PybrP1_004611, partial [[Pythium] brassicae (nom. inval.)]